MKTHWLHDDSLRCCRGPGGAYAACASVLLKQSPPCNGEYGLTATFSAQNNPLYLESFQSGTDEDALKFHYVVHCSLDGVEEKCKR